MPILNFSAALLLLSFYILPVISAAGFHFPLPRGYTTSALDVGSGITLSYLDSGAPPAYPYKTIFAIHGMGFQNAVWSKVLDIAASSNARFVAINRRDYNGSTAYTSSELDTFNNGSVDDRADFYQARGKEFATFIESFIKQNNLPAPSSDGKTGGVALLGWSLGNTFTISTVGHIKTYPSSTQQTLAKYLRGLIMQEPPSDSLGLDVPPQTWSPQIDTSIPAEDRQPGFVQWITAYFNHGDLSTRDPSVLEYVLPSIDHVPSVFTFSEAQLTAIANVPAANKGDTSIIVYGQDALLPIYKSALFNTTTRAALPLMKVLQFTGDITADFGIVAKWQIEDDDAAAGGGFVTTQFLNGTNHFAHWDQPSLALSTYLSVFNL